MADNQFQITKYLELRDMAEKLGFDDDVAHWNTKLAELGHEE